MYKLVLFLFYLLHTCACVTIHIQTGIIGPWKQIEVNGNHISSNIVKWGFVSKLHFEEEEEIDEDDQIQSITRLVGLVEFEMKNIGQLKLPEFKRLDLIKSMKFNGNQISHVDNKSLSQITPRILDLSNNQISKIDDGAFGDLLETLVLKCNELTTISPSWFSDTESLQNLRLTGNKIIVLPENFNVFSNLQDIHLNSNKLKEIQDGALSQKRYTYIDLSYNFLTELKSTIFKSKDVEIMYINLRANHLNFLSTEFMDSINVSVETTLDLNPWICPCYDVIREKWLHRLVLVNQKNSWLDAQAEDHAHRREASCVFDAMKSKKCKEVIDEESTKYYLDNIENFDIELCS